MKPIPSGSRTARRNFRVDTLISIRFIAHLPSQSPAPEVAHAGPPNRHLAGVEADLALGLAPAMSAPAIAAGMASPAGLLGVLFHHGPERLDPGRQAEPIKADRNGVPSFAHSPHSSRRRSDQCCANFLHGVAFLRGFDTPSLPAQGEQRRSSYFNIPRGNSEI